MVKESKTPDWREARRRSARDAIVEAAWAVVAEEGLAGLSLRDLAHRVGVTTPTLYAYFDSKNAIYDAMFGQASTELAQKLIEPFDCEDPRELLLAGVRRFVQFCTSDAARYQLLFQRTIRGFEPSPESFAPSMRALGEAQKWLKLNGITETPHLDMWTALVIGLVDQQVSNDPGGDRWLCLLDEAMDMYLAHCRPAGASGRETSPRLRAKDA